MANNSSFPLLGDLNAEESLLLMCLIEYVPEITKRLAPLIKQVGTIESEMLKEASLALIKEKITISLINYDLHLIAGNTVRQYFTRVSGLAAINEQRILTTFFEVDYAVSSLKKAVPFNYPLVAGAAIHNIIHCNKRTVVDNKTIDFTVTNSFENKLQLNEKITNYFSVIIGNK